MKKLTNEESKVYKAYLSGVSVANIARQKKVSREAIYSKLRKVRNWEKVKEKLFIERADNKSIQAWQVKKAVEGGMDRSDAVEKYNICIATLYKYHPELSSYKLDASRKVSESIAKDWFDGMTYESIATKYGMHTSNIQRRLKSVYKNGWEQARKDRKSHTRK